MLLNVLLVGCGGFVGAALRYCVTLLSNHISVLFCGHQVIFPIATLIINFIGCFFMGILAMYVPYKFSNIASRLTLFLGTGILGGFTTLSAFSLETYKLFMGNNAGIASIYVVLTFICALAGLVAGVAIGRILAR